MLHRLTSLPRARHAWQSFLAKLFNPSCKQATRKQHCFRPQLEVLEERETPAVFLVTSTANGVPGANDGSLRDAILAANANPGLDTIEFDIESTDSYGDATITLTSPLPTLADPVTIDGTSQPGWFGQPLIYLDGSVLAPNFYPFTGLTTTADGCTIKGLEFESFPGSGIGIFSNNNVVRGCSFFNNGRFGGNDITITNAATGNIIGGTKPFDKNFIDSTSNSGVLITGLSSDNTVEGNAFGTYDYNVSIAIQINGGAHNNTIGGTSAGAGNTIVTSSKQGIFIDSTSNGNVIEGNKIGSYLDIYYPNAIGIEIAGSNNTVGGTAAGAGNIISGNTNQGILVDATASGTLIEGNQIGTDTTGTASVPNEVGIEVAGSTTTIGGATGGGNLISGNTLSGILVDSSANGTLIQGNKIGTDITGASPLGNGGNGVALLGSNTTLGGSGAGDANIIAFNQNDGVFVAIAANDDTIRQNSIFANALNGIQLGLNFNGGPGGPGNNGQAAPTLTSATFNASTKKLTINGRMPNTATATVYTLDFFANKTGEIQGRVFLGSATITSKVGATGTSSAFTPISLPITATAFSSATTPMITATATDTTLGNTSQFSNAVHDPVLAAPAFTSAKTAAFTVTTPGSFAVATSGFPTPTLTATGTLPKGITFNHTTGVLSGTPAAGSSGTYHLNVIARNGIGAAASETITIDVNKLVTSVAIPDQVTVTAPTKVTALGDNRTEALFTLTEAATTSLAGWLSIIGFSNLPPDVTFDSSTSAAFPKNKKLTLAVVFTNKSTSSLAPLLTELTPLVDEIVA